MNFYASASAPSLYALFAKLYPEVRNQSGNITLYALVALPLVLTLSMLAVDVSAYHSLRDEAQQEADRIVLLGAKALPDTVTARALVEQAVSSLPRLNLATAADGTPMLSVSDSRIALTLEGRQDAAFDLFLAAATGESRPFTVRERAEAQVVPGDTVIIFSDSQSLRPRPGEAWGGAFDWPASKYFNFVRNPNIDGALTVSAEESESVWPSWWEQWNSPTFRRWATQACFNPVYSNLKYALISLVDFNLAVGSNRIAVLSTPGNAPSRGFEVLRPLSFADSSGPEAAWVGYLDAANYIADEACLLFSAPESSGEDRYSIPAPLLPVSARSSSHCTERLQSTGWGEFYFPAGKVSNCWANNVLPLREAVWYHSARSTSVDRDATPIIAALNEAVQQLIVADANNSAVPRRGSLADRPIRRIILFSDHLPELDAAGVPEFFRRVEQMGARVHIVGYHHEGLSPEAGSRLEQRASALATARTTADLTVRLARNPEELLSEILPQLNAGEREYVLRR